MVYVGVIAIMITAVIVNHMGLIEAIEKVINKKLPVLNCAMCLTFWSTLVWLSISRFKPYGWFVIVPAIASVAAYLVPWLELLFGLLSILYEKVYKKIFPEETNNDEQKKSACSKDSKRKTSDM